MLGSRVCWLLGWALLLGQPIFGNSQESFLEEPNDQLPKLEGSEQQEKPEEKPLSEEELEETQKEERAWLEHEREKPCSPWLQYLQATALGHYNKKQNDYYKQHGEATLRTKKAIAGLFSLKLVLVKTNCTTDQLPGDLPHGRFPHHMDYYNYKFPKNCESLEGSEKECTYTLFEDLRNRQYRSMFVLNEKCHPMS